MTLLLRAMRGPGALAVAFAALLAAAPAAAQPDWTATPTFGTLDLATGFDPDPRAVNVRAGGADAVAVGALPTGEGCPGYIDAAAPTVDVNVATDGVLPLSFYVRAGFDTVLLVYTPAGEWLCNDDEAGTSAGLTLASPEAGNYNVWVGTFERPADPAADTLAATLYVSELPPAAPAHEAEPAFGTLALAAGFEPDPREVAVVAGGQTALVPALTDAACVGFVNGAAPTVALAYAGDGRAPFRLVARAEADAVLAVRTPSGAWLCDDDGDEGTDPGVNVEAPEPGRYAVWVGTYAARAATTPPAPARLLVTETLPAPDPDEGATSEGGAGGTRGYGRGAGAGVPAMPYAPTPEDEPRLIEAPAFGTLALRRGFRPDPQQRRVRAGGSDRVRIVGPGCGGYVTDARPDVNLTYEGGGTLVLYARSEVDTVLLVNTPSGQWLCGDDFDGGNDPLITLLNAAPGLYNVWVGTYRPDDRGRPATLHVGSRPPD